MIYGLIVLNQMCQKDLQMKYLYTVVWIEHGSE